MLLDVKRQMLPRWRSHRAAAASGELNSLKKRQPLLLPDDKLFPDKIVAWQQVPSMVHAIELVSAAIVLGKESEVVDAAEFVLCHDLHQAPAVRHAAQTTLARASGDMKPVYEEKESQDTVQQAICHVRSLRRSLQNDSRNSLAWTDLAREYAVLGQNEKSKSAIRIALKLQPSNRFVLRSAVRLYVHLDQPDVAYDLVRRQPVTRYDPWLLCVEIAVATLADKTSHFIREGRMLIEQSQHAPHQTAELAATIATLELNAGDNRRAKKFFYKSLIDPTENAVAQAEWASRQSAGIICSAELIAVMNSHEARTYEQCQKNNWHDAVESCHRWWLNEPFSSVPASLGSFLAISAFEDFKLAEDFAMAGLKANPKDAVLLNNLTVALLLQGRVSEAEKEFEKISFSTADEDSKTVGLATQGMVYFRKGQYEEGRKMYTQAIEEAKRKKQKEIGILALLYLLREELLAGLISPDDTNWVLEKTASYPSLIIQAVTSMLKKNYVAPTIDGELTLNPTLLQYKSPLLDQPLFKRVKVSPSQIAQVIQATE